MGIGFLTVIMDFFEVHFDDAIKTEMQSRSSIDCPLTILSKNLCQLEDVFHGSIEWIISHTSHTPVQH